MGILAFTKGHIHDKELIQKLWQTFRIGQTTYVSFMIGLINFVLILYKLGGIDKYIDPLPFAILIAVILVPLGIILGIIHLKKQIPTEAKIMTHHNPYIYKAIPASKETMEIKYQMWNFEQVQVANNFIEFQSDMNKKLWTALNELTGKDIFTKDDMDKMDMIKNNATTIKKGSVEWKEKYRQLYQGKLTKEIPHVEDYDELEEDNNKKD